MIFSNLKTIFSFHSTKGVVPCDRISNQLLYRSNQIHDKISESEIFHDFKRLLNWAGSYLEMVNLNTYRLSSFVLYEIKFSSNFNRTQKKTVLIRHRNPVEVDWSLEIMQK